MLNYRVRFKIHFWCIRIRKGIQVGFGTYFGGNKLGFLYNSANLNSISWKSHQSALEGYSALHKDSTRFEDHEMWNWPHFEDYSLCFSIKFWLSIFSAYLIHAFRISKLHCKAIKLKVEEELRVRFWILYLTVIVWKTYSEIYQACKLLSFVVVRPSFIFVHAYELNVFYCLCLMLLW